MSDPTTESALALRRRALALVGVVGLWGLLAGAAAIFGPRLSTAWPAWRYAFAAGAVWGGISLILVYGMKGRLTVSRFPFLAVAFAFLMTTFGWGSYWATTLLYPTFRVGIERAAWFVALCTAVMAATSTVTERLLQPLPRPRQPLVWDWPRLRAVTLVLFGVAALGSAVTLTRIGYFPAIVGDPYNLRFQFPAIGGIWYRLSMLGGVVALLVAARMVARHATGLDYMIGAASLIMVGAYGPRFFIALPLGVALLLWDGHRRPLRLWTAAAGALVVIPLGALAWQFRQWREGFAALTPLAHALYGALGEFRDLAWALDHFGIGDRFLHGGTLGSLIVPLLPTPAWRLVGIDKLSVYSHNSATILADEMGRDTPQRIGAYGEFYLNFGWTGALLGAVLYGVLLAYLDNAFRRAAGDQVRSLWIALAAATAIFAQVGQLNMFTSTLTSAGYPLVLVVILSARLSSSTT